MNRNKIPILSFLNCSRVLIAAFVFIMSVTMVAAEDCKIVAANNQFGMELFNKVAVDDDNKLISPFSAHVVLSMAYQGAAGKTAQNMASVFHLPDPQSTANEYHNIIEKLAKVESVTLKIANKIYIENKFKLNPAFKKVIEEKFLSEADEIEFKENVKAAGTINTWVEDKTNKKITNLISPDMLDASTRLVLLNAVYFKGNWSKKFDASQTSKKPFHLLNGEEVQVDMMHKNAKFRYSENADLDCKFLELPYEGNELSMVVILPNEHKGMTKLQEKLSSFNFSSIYQDLSEHEVDVHLPKFKIESTIPMKDNLVELGAGHMFSDAADFSNMADEPLKVSDVIQKTFIEVNEEGAEAAAATGMIMMTRCMPMPVRHATFNVDHSFGFALVYRAEQKPFLFFGKVTKP